MADTPVESPFQIDITENPIMNCHDLMLRVGLLTKDEAEALGDLLSDWMIEESGWKARVQ